MDKRFKNLISLLLAGIIVLQVMWLAPLNSRADDIGDFVDRCYSLTLGREADQEGHDYWCSELTLGHITGSCVAYKFIFSDEFISKNVSDDQYVNTLYALFMGRQADEEGLRFWTEQLQAVPKGAVFAGFANSKEFYDICEGFNIVAGYFSLEYDLESLNNVNLFVDRLYYSTLQRTGDLEGQAHWVKGLLDGQFTGASCASFFLLGNEFSNSVKSNDSFVDILYWTFMGRGSDDEGKAFWLSELANGRSREYVFTGFVCSPEFDVICNYYGIIKGDYVCSNPNGNPSDYQTATPTPSLAAEPDWNIVAKFEALEGVDFVDCYHDDPDLLRFTVEQPVDWKDPNGEKFKQHFTIDYSGYDNINVMYVNGYYLEDYTMELTEIYNANQISVEHRFFRQSVPDGFKNGDTQNTYWQYLTMENAASDFHHIIELMKQVFTNKWIFTGGSKGGCITNCQSMFYPDDADVYVAYVAPLFSSTSTPGLGDYLYTKVGDERYGKEKAAEYRQLVLDYQIALLELRAELNDFSDDKSCGLTREQIYDIFVMDQAVGIWQYGTDFDRLKTVVDKYNKKEPGYLYEISSYYEDNSFYADDEAFEGVDYSPYSPFEPYFINCAMELGCYAYEFDYIREALEERGSDAYLAISKADEKDLYVRSSLDKETFASLQFDTSLYKKQVEWTHTTKCTVIELYGSSDTLSGFKYPEAKDNPNYHVFTAKNKCHQADFSDSEIWPEVKKIIDEALAA